MSSRAGRRRARSLITIPGMPPCICARCAVLVRFLCDAARQHPYPSGHVYCESSYLISPAALGTLTAYTRCLAPTLASPIASGPLSGGASVSAVTHAEIPTKCPVSARRQPLHVVGLLDGPVVLQSLRRGPAHPSASHMFLCVSLLMDRWWP